MILHQKAKHFKCLCCSRRLNSASGLVVHMAQVHKETIDSVPNAVKGHDTPEIEIFGMQGVPPEDLQRHFDGLPIVPYKKSRLGEAGLVSLLAAQKAATSGNPLPMSVHVPLRQVQIIEGIGPSQAIPHVPKMAEQQSQFQYQMPVEPSYLQPAHFSPPMYQHAPAAPITKEAVEEIGNVAFEPVKESFTPYRIESTFDQKTGKRMPTSFIMISDVEMSPVLPF